MERLGLVWQVEQELERVIALGQLPKDGGLPSEHTLARRYGVSRTTVREALLRLGTRGLVVQHPGRKSRAVALDEAVTLENLSVALHEGSHAAAERRRLLEGYFTLKRETTVELLAICCEQACEEDLKQLEEVCLSLEEAARWQQHSRWARGEFELLRQAALIAGRPGHFLLIQSLERSFWGMAARVVPQLDREAVVEWARYVAGALGDRDAQALRRHLSTLLLAGDEQLLHRLMPVRSAHVVSEPPTPPQPPALASSVAEPTRGALSGSGCQNLPACPTGHVPLLPSCLTAPLSPGSSTPELAEGALAETACLNLPSCRTTLRHAPPTGSAPSGSAFTGLGQPSDHRGLEACRIPGHREEAGGDTCPPMSWGAPSPADAEMGAAEPANRTRASTSGFQRAAAERTLPKPTGLPDSFAPCAVSLEPGAGRPHTLPPQEPQEDAKAPALLAMLRWMLRWLARVPPFNTLSD